MKSSRHNLPEKVESYGNKDYWENRFLVEDEYDWLCSYESFDSVLQHQLSPDDRILILGCGNSRLASQLYDAGYKDITNIDYSQNVINSMREKYKHLKEVKWLVMDILDMTFEPKEFNVVIEKATLDSFLVAEKDPWNISENGKGTIDRILSQVQQVLPSGGKFISITWAQPHFRKRLLARPEYQWSIDTETFGCGFSYFVYVMTKGHDLAVSDLAYSLPRVTQQDSTSNVTLPPDTLEDVVSGFLSIDS